MRFSLGKFPPKTIYRLIKNFFTKLFFLCIQKLFFSNFVSYNFSLQLFRVTFRAIFHATFRATFSCNFSDNFSYNFIPFLEMCQLFLLLFTTSFNFFRITQQFFFLSNLKLNASHKPIHKKFN